MDCRILERLGFDSCMAVLEKKQNLASRGGHGHVREKRPNLPCSPSSRSLANHMAPLTMTTSAGYVMKLSSLVRYL